ncbi:hypothetical protein [Sinomicrobium sp. M5D2P9]
MEKFQITIDASREKVWDVLWDEDTYPVWTAPFSESSQVKTDQWEEGSKVLFIDGNSGEGMVSTIAKNIPGEFMSFRHIGIYKNGVEDTESAKAKEWSGEENYTLKTIDGKTELVVEMNIDEQHKSMFASLWPKALGKVKELAEEK